MPKRGLRHLHPDKSSVANEAKEIKQKRIDDSIYQLYDDSVALPLTKIQVNPQDPDDLEPYVCEKETLISISEAD